MGCLSVVHSAASTWYLKAITRNHTNFINDRLKLNKPKEDGKFKFLAEIEDIL